MTLAALLALVHGDDPNMDLLYFWAAVLLALTPVLIFGTIGVLVLRKILQHSRAPQDGDVPGDGAVGDATGPH